MGTTCRSAVILGFAALLSPIYADQPITDADRRLASERAVKAVTDLNTAMLTGDFAKAVNLMCPAVVQYFGGREKTIEAIAGSQHRLEAQGFGPFAAKAGLPLARLYYELRKLPLL